jgi:hypothetical protein
MERVINPKMTDGVDLAAPLVFSGVTCIVGLPLAMPCQSEVKLERSHEKALSMPIQVKCSFHDIDKDKEKSRARDGDFAPSSADKILREKGK